MELRPLLRPAVQLLNTCRLPTAAAAAAATTTLPLISTRGHKTTARTKRSLKMAPHNSFLPDRSAAYPAADSIIYNPPSSEASPAHTPFLFLPRSDPRRLALLRMRADHSGSSSIVGGDPARGRDLPPQLKYKHRDPKSNMTAADVQEMRRLRADDPLQWSVGHLAKKFDCSPIFVQMAAPASPEHLQWLKGKMERKMERWGPKKTQAREDRRKRAEMLYRGEL